MINYAESIRLRLSGGPQTARQLSDYLGISQPTFSRVMATLGDEVVRLGAARSIQYVLRDKSRGLPTLPIYRVSVEGTVVLLGMLVPVRPEGFVMQQEDGLSLHSHGLPWWLYDMRPQGYLGRAYATRHGIALGLPPHLNEWTDTQALQALMVHGEDGVGNLLLGDVARERFLNLQVHAPISLTEKAACYARLAIDAARGEHPGSSAGGEQPKFTAYAMTDDGPHHVIVKFTEIEANAVSERWRDLLLAEHLALATLREAGLPAVKSALVEHGNQRFLEVERFDRVNTMGRRGIISLAALDAEFVGMGLAPWPVVVQRLLSERQIEVESAAMVSRLWAFGMLIGNTDMHLGNLSFVTEQGRPYRLAPAYDMTPMAFAPRTGGGLPDSLSGAILHASVQNSIWKESLLLAQEFLARVQQESRFSQRFSPCIDALARHISDASEKVQRLG